MLQLQRWWYKSGLGCGTLAKGFQTDQWLKILDGCRFFSLLEVGKVSLEKAGAPKSTIIQNLLKRIA